MYTDIIIGVLATLAAYGLAAVLALFITYTK